MTRISHVQMDWLLIVLFALKGQQPIAQGNALGGFMQQNSPCKGKSIRRQTMMKSTLLPFQGVDTISQVTQGVALGYGLLPLAFPFGQRPLVQGVLKCSFPNKL